MIVFLLLPVVGATYAGWRVWHILPLTNCWRWIVVGLLLICLLSFAVVLSRSIDSWPLPLASTVYEMGTSSVFVLLYLVMLFLLLDLGRLAKLVPKSFLSGSLTGTLTVLLLVGSVFTYGYLHYLHKVRQPITLVNGKQAAKARRIVMLTDLHLGYHNRLAELHRWVDIINAEKPDLVLIAGDIIDISVRPVNEQNMAQEFRRIVAPVYTCLGNHEYYSGNPESKKFYEEAGIHLLCDSAATVLGINIIGRDDRTNPHRASLRELTIDIDTSLYTIVLDHQPYHLEEAEQAGIDFQLSGHTHRGQVWPISWITDAIYEQSHGALKRGDTHYYVSSGIGIWGGKFRIGTRSEYVVAEIADKQ